MSQSKSQRGRPRDPDIDASVLDATSQLMSEVGYSRLSIEAIARRAGTTKPALYRRWPARQHLVLEAVASRLQPIKTPALDCVLCELVEVIASSIAAFKPIPPGVLLALLADCVADSELYLRCTTLLFDPPRTTFEHVLRRSVARGELRADLDVPTTVNMLNSHISGAALLTPRPPTDGDAKRAVVVLLHGLATDYATLIDRCEADTEKPGTRTTHRSVAPARQRSAEGTRNG